MSDADALLDLALMRGIATSDVGVLESGAPTSFGGTQVTEDEKLGIHDEVAALFATDEMRAQVDENRRFALARIVTNQALERMGSPLWPSPVASLRS